MPVTRQRTVTVRDLRPGQILTAYGEIKAISKKLKWASVITDVDPEFTHRLALDWKVEICEEVPTYEERVELERKMVVDWVNRQITKAEAQLDSIRKTVKATIDRDHFIADYQVAALVTAQASYHLWSRIANAAKTRDLLEVVQETRENILYDLTNASYASRSTCTVSNAVKDVERDVQTQFVRSVQLYMRA